MHYVVKVQASLLYVKDPYSLLYLRLTTIAAYIINQASFLCRFCIIAYSSSDFVDKTCLYIKEMQLITQHDNTAFFNNNK